MPNLTTIYENLLELHIYQLSIKTDIIKIFDKTSEYFDKIFYQLNKNPVVYYQFALISLESEVYRVDAMKKILDDNKINIEEVEHSCDSNSKNKEFKELSEYLQLKKKYCAVIYRKLIDLNCIYDLFDRRKTKCIERYYSKTIFTDNDRSLENIIKHSESC